MGTHRRFYIRPEQIVENEITLTGDTARQISKVLRLKPGDQICTFDGTGHEYGALISGLSKDEVKATIDSKIVCHIEPNLHLTLAICPPKNDKIDLIVQKTTELGISEIVIVDSERVVAKFDSSKSADKLERWRRIASEAAEQSGRGIVPKIEGVIKFNDLADIIKNASLALIAWEEETERSLKVVLRQHEDVDSVILIIGPEGGLTRSEVESAISAGAVSVSLGKRLLRSETAAIAASAVVMYEIDGEL